MSSAILGGDTRERERESLCLGTADGEDRIIHRLRFCLFVFKYPMQIIDAKVEGNFCCCCHQLSETSLNQASETGGPGALYLWRHTWLGRSVLWRCQPLFSRFCC